MGVVEARFGCQSVLGHRNRCVASADAISPSVCDEGDRSDCGMVRSELVVELSSFQNVVRIANVENADHHRRLLAPSDLVGKCSGAQGNEVQRRTAKALSLIHISEPTRPY